MRSKPKKPSAWKRTLVVASISSVLSTNAYAAEPQIETLEAGESAPFTGDLFPIGSSVRWALEISYCEQRNRLALEHAQRTFQVDRELYVGIAQASAQADKERIKLLTAELDASRAWHRSPGFVATMAALVSVGVLVTAAIVVNTLPEVTR